MVRDGGRASSAVAALTAALLLLGGCANTSPPSQQVAVPAPAPAQPTLQEWMEQAQSAQLSGQRERARQAWRSAAKAYPTQKAPWQRLAENYFDAADYGNAILAAQEVLQRDSQDTLAHSVVAVSGLRLSTVSLVALRERSSYPVGSRDEALGLTRAMREALGETTLVPPRAEAPVRAAAQPTGSRVTAQPVAATPRPSALASPSGAPVATPAVNTVPAGAARSGGPVGAGTAVPVSAQPAARPAPAAAPRPAPPAPAPKPASADPFKLLN